ncbi:MAG TPA: response regulator transcription factor [Phycisphaerae bacterium]|nr:response regulator transcription factor [Phycisphaerae bacterium]
MLTLVIGDPQRLFREAVAAHLARQPGIAAVHQADNSEQVLDLVCREHPGLVILDCELPGRDPFATLAEVRRLNDRCKVLFWCDHCCDTHFEAALACGADGFLLKKDPLTVLDRAFRQVMDGGSFFSPLIQERLVLDDGHWRLTRPRTGPLACLTDHEYDLLRLLADGQTLKQAAADLNITYKSADYLKTGITRKLNIHDRVQLALFAMREGLACPTGPSSSAQHRTANSS